MLSCQDVAHSSSRNSLFRFFRFLEVGSLLCGFVQISGLAHFHMSEWVSAFCLTTGHIGQNDAFSLSSICVSVCSSCDVQEAIVKIMKMRKTISCAKLQMELITMLSNMFVPTKRMMKEQCEWLIENQYMRRDDNNMDTFIYIA